MSQTKIKAALIALDKATKGAFKVLNEVTDGAFEGSPAEAEPTRYANEISQRLQKQYDHLEANARYEGMSEQEIAEQRATETADAQAKLQEESAERLKKLKPAPVEDVEDFENLEDEDPEGTEEPAS